MILEHFDYDLGLEYLKRLRPETIEKYKQNQNLKRLSEVGSPRRYYFRHFGWVSPTVLRYLYVDQDLTDIFEMDKVSSVSEIGVGFGGQLIVTSNLHKISNFGAYDLPQVLVLLQKFVSQLGDVRTSISFKQINPLASAKYDLTVSNYAFSELPRNVQIEYIDKVLAHATRGYLTMNSGRSNYT